MMKTLARLRRGHRSSEGFSLIEVMIALTFLGIGLLAVAQLIPLGMSGITQARVRTNAVQAAQQQLDELKAADYSSAALAAGTYEETVGQYTISWTISDNTPVPGSKRIDMSASWPTVTGTKNANLATFVTAR
jgi:prepilin-type N-terminal cleavage/methylation domain-containing protein